MLSNQWPLGAREAIRTFAFLTGITAAAVGWYAARLWVKASAIPFPEYDPPFQSASDFPELHTLSTAVHVNNVVNALEASARLNAVAAKWSAFAAMLTGLAGALSII